MSAAADPPSRADHAHPSGGTATCLSMQRGAGISWIFVFFSLVLLIRSAANLISERRLMHFIITYISVSHPLCILQDDDGKVESRFD